MKRVLSAALLSCALVVLTGCGGIAGHWTLRSIEPESAQGEFQFGWLCLADDGGYRAEATYGGETKVLDGTYEYDKSTKMLKFVAGQGMERTYKADIQCPGSTMKVSSTEEGKDWTATMKRCKCDPAKCKPKE
jgi:hypothetical protein